MALRATVMQDRPVLRFSLRSEPGHRPCYRACTYHTLCIRSLTPTFFRERADNSPPTGPFGAGKNVAQSADMPRPAAALSRSLLTRPPRSGGAGTAPACRHPARQPPVAAASFIRRGRPQPPPTPDARPLHPQGAAPSASAPPLRNSAATSMVSPFSLPANSVNLSHAETGR